MLQSVTRVLPPLRTQERRRRLELVALAEARVLLGGVREERGAPDGQLLLDELLEFTAVCATRRGGGHEKDKTEQAGGG